MSHVTTIDLDIRDLGALAAAAKRCGCELVTEQSTYRWYGTHVGDYPLPAGFAQEDLGKCDHAIRIPADQPSGKSAYEVGIARRRDGEPGFVPLMDFWGVDGRAIQERVGEGGNRLKQAYAAEVALKEARQQGYQVTEQTLEDGSIELMLMT